jgi:hypothetical protein
MELHPECTKRLEELLAQYLEQFLVTNNRYLDYKSTLGFWEKVRDVIPNGNAKDQFVEILGDDPFHFFILNEVSRNIEESNEYSSDESPKKLTSFEGYQDTNIAAKRLAESFCALPRKYIVTFELNEKLSQGLSTILEKRHPIGSYLELFRPDSTYDTFIPLSSNNKKRQEGLFGATILTNDPRKWNPERSYLKIICEGYLDKYGQSLTYENLISDVKSFLGLAIATSLIVSTRWGEHPFELPKQAFARVHLVREKEFEIQSTIRLSREMASVMEHLVLLDVNEEITEQVHREYIRGWLSMIGVAFHDRTNCQKLLLAGQWLFESH